MSPPSLEEALPSTLIHAIRLPHVNLSAFHTILEIYMCVCARVATISKDIIFFAFDYGCPTY
jgi:hypothetical protein